MNRTHYADMFLESLKYMGETPELINAYFIACIKMLNVQKGTSEQLAALVEAHDKLTRGESA